MAEVVKSNLPKPHRLDATIKCIAYGVGMERRSVGGHEHEVVVTTLPSVADLIPAVFPPSSLLVERNDSSVV